MSRAGRAALLAWRLCRQPLPTLNGDGARLYGVRWNNSGQPLLYMASTPALCVLEMRVHLDLPFSMIPDDDVFMTIYLGDLAVERLAGEAADPVSAGHCWLAEGQTPVLEVASAIIAESSHLLLNPAHPGAAQAKTSSVRRFSFDQPTLTPRLKRSADTELGRDRTGSFHRVPRVLRHHGRDRTLIFQ